MATTPLDMTPHVDLAIAAAFNSTKLADFEAEALIRKALAELPASPDCALLVRQRIEARLRLIDEDPAAAAVAFREDARRMQEHAEALERYLATRKA